MKKTRPILSIELIQSVQDNRHYVIFSRRGDGFCDDKRYEPGKSSLIRICQILFEKFNDLELTK